MKSEAYSVNRRYIQKLIISFVWPVNAGVLHQTRCKAKSGISTHARLGSARSGEKKKMLIFHDNIMSQMMLYPARTRLVMAEKGIFIMLISLNTPDSLYL